MTAGAPTRPERPFRFTREQHCGVRAPLFVELYLAERVAEDVADQFGLCPAFHTFGNPRGGFIPVSSPNCGTDGLGRCHRRTISRDRDGRGCCEIGGAVRPVVGTLAIESAGRFGLDPLPLSQLEELVRDLLAQINPPPPPLGEKLSGTAGTGATEESQSPACGRVARRPAFLKELQHLFRVFARQPLFLSHRLPSASPSA